MSIHRDVYVRCDIQAPGCHHVPQIAAPGRTAADARAQARDLDRWHHHGAHDICAPCWTAGHRTAPTTRRPDQPEHHTTETR
ncbi:hypothetical protein [Embleya sp. NPDC001921]